MNELLIERVKAGDADAWRELVSRFVDPLYRYVYFRVGMRKEEAEDLLQKTLMTAVEKMEGFRGDETGWFRWCCAIARNHIQHAWRSHGRRESREKFMNEIEKELAHWLEQEGGVEHVWPDGILERTRLNENVSAALSLLPPHYQQILVGKYEMERSVAELSQELGLSFKAVESLLTRARDAFQLAFLRLEKEESV